MKVAVLDFSTPEGATCGLSAPLAEELTTRLFDHDRFSIIERRMLSKVLAENSSTQTDLFDPAAVARLGRLMGADGVVTGTITASQRDYTLNARIIVVESAEVSSVAQVEMPLSAAEQRGRCRGGAPVALAGATAPSGGPAGTPSATARSASAGIVFAEDFQRVEEGIVPEGWSADDGVGVTRQGRTKALCQMQSGAHKVSTPPIDLPADFSIEASALWGRSHYSNQSLSLSVGAVSASIDTYEVHLTNATGLRGPGETYTGKRTALRLEKRGPVFRLYADGKQLLLSRISNFEAAAGTPLVFDVNGVDFCLYGLTVKSL